jgi:hypothetical protein
VAIVLGVTEAAIAQPQPDPAPDPSPPSSSPPATAPPPTTTPPPATTPSPGPKPQLRKPHGRKQRPQQTAEPTGPVVAATKQPLHPSRAEIGPPYALGLADLAASSTAATGSATHSSLSPAAEVGLLLLLGAALAGLAFATVPASVLARVSAPFAEHRQDIGLALALTIAASAAIFVVVVVAT